MLSGTTRSALTLRLEDRPLLKTALYAGFMFGSTGRSDTLGEPDPSTTIRQRYELPAEGTYDRWPRARSPREVSAIPLTLAYATVRPTLVNHDAFGNRY